MFCVYLNSSHKNYIALGLNLLGMVYIFLNITLIYLNINITTVLTVKKLIEQTKTNTLTYLNKLIINCSQKRTAQQSWTCTFFGCCVPHKIIQKYWSTKLLTKYQWQYVHFVVSTLILYQFRFILYKYIISKETY